MKQILTGSLLCQWILKLFSFYSNSAIARFFNEIAKAYKTSKFKTFWDEFIGVKIPTAKNSIFVRVTMRFSKLVVLIGDVARSSALYKIINKTVPKTLEFLGGGIIGKVLGFFGFRELLILSVALYLPLDYFLRSVVSISVLASIWDEGVLALAIAYLLAKRSANKDISQSRVTPIETYLIMYFGVLFFLMCAVSPNMSIAIAGYRAAMQYMLWFFVTIRLIENRRDFTIFYSTLCIVAILIGLHGIYQYIIAAPIPSSWVSTTEESVRTRVYSLTGSPNIMGSFLVLFAPMVAAIAYYSNKMWVKVCAICATGMMCLSVIFTFSKGAWGGLAVAVIIFALYLDRRLIALMAVGGTGALICIPSIASRITYLFTADYALASATAGRTVRWTMGLSLLHANDEWIGFGLGRFGGAVAMQNKVIEETDAFYYFYMDNYYLKVLVESGYIGLIAYVILLIGMAVWCMRAIGRITSKPMKTLAVGMFSGMCGVLVHCYFENIFEVPYMMGYFWAMAAAILYLGYFDKKKT